jgi:hypothetical protein
MNNIKQSAERNQGFSSSQELKLGREGDLFKTM